MKTNGNDKALESYKIFPYVAWIVVISFTIFVYSLAMELRAVTNDLHQQSEYKQNLVSTPVDQITDFEK